MNGFTNWDSELYHYGVLGMKWGVRRYQNPDGSLTAEGQKRYYKELKQMGKKLGPNEAVYKKMVGTKIATDIRRQVDPLIKTWEKSAKNPKVTSELTKADYDYANAYYRAQGIAQKYLGKYGNKKIISVYNGRKYKSKAIDALIMAVFQTKLQR